MPTFTESLATRGATAPLDKLFRNMQRAVDSNPYDLPNYGSGPTAGRTAPTLTWATTAGTGKTQLRSMNDAAGNDFASYYGGIPTQLAGTSYGFPIVSSTVANIPSGSGLGALGWAFEFVTDDEAPAIQTAFSGTSQYRVLVDGQFVSRTPAVMPNQNGGGPQWLQIAFATDGKSAKGRVIRFESELNLALRAIACAPTARIWRPEVVDFTRLAWLGDSYTAYTTQSGVANSFAHDNFALLTMRLLGVTDANPLGVAGSGIATDNPSVGLRYGSRAGDIDRLQARAGGVDAVVVQGSINDRDKAPDLVRSELLALLPRIRASIGAGKPIFVLGVPAGALGSGLTANANIVAVEQAIAAAVATYADPLVGFVPLSTQTPTPALYGDATTGNASAYVQADLIHNTFGASVPGTGGMEYLSRIAARGIRAAATAMRR